MKKTTMRKKISEEQRKKEGKIHALYGKLFGCNLSGEALSRVIYNMRLSFTRSQLEEFATRSYTKVPKIKSAIWGERYPKTIEQIGGTKHYFFKAKDFRREMNWLSVQISLEAKKISDYVHKRDEVERLILLGQLSQAESALENILKDFGYSVWYYEMKFLILARQDKEDKIWKLETEINEKKNQTSYFAYLIYSLAKRSMKNNSAFNYDAELDSQIERSRTSFLKDQCDFFHLFLNFYRNYAEKDVTAAISMVSPFIICLIAAFFRKIAINKKEKISFFISKMLIILLSLIFLFFIQNSFYNIYLYNNNYTLVFAPYRRSFREIPFGDIWNSKIYNFLKR